MRISVNGIDFSYDSDPVLKDMGFEAKEGDIVAILGPNGAGKTTFLKCINSIHKPASGSILVDDTEIVGMERESIARIMGYVPQGATTSGSTVFESVLIGRKPHMGLEVSDKDLRIVSRTIDMLGLSHISEKKVNEISGGEYQMVQIARAIVQQPKVLLLDEPSSNLDLRNQYSILHTICHIVEANGMCAIMVNHDINLALRFCNRFVLMKNGGIFAAGGVEVMTPSNIYEVYGIDVNVGEVDGYKVVVPKELDHILSPKVLEFLSKRKDNPKQKDFFNDRAKGWDDISRHDEKKLEHIANVIGLKPSDKILDVGTGTGVMIPYYLDRLENGHIIAVDYSENMIEVAKSKHPESERLSYRVQDIYEMEDSKEYDKIICFSCFPHFPDPMRAIKVLTHALKEGGELVIAHSSSKEEINHVHETGGAEICNDYLPPAEIMGEMYEACGLEVTMSRDNDDYYIVIGIKL